MSLGEDKEYNKVKHLPVISSPSPRRQEDGSERPRPFDGQTWEGRASPPPTSAGENAATLGFNF